MRQIILLLLSAVVSGCGPGAAPDRNVKETINAKDVLGSWRMSTNSLALLVGDGFRPGPTNQYTIDFKADGSCIFQSVESFPSQHRYVSARGTWKLAHDTGGDSNIKKKNTLRLALLVNGEEHIQYLNFARESGVLILWNVFTPWNDHAEPAPWPYIEYRRGG